MKTYIPFAIALCVSILFLAACGQSRISKYPDGSADTTRRVEDIKQNARDQKAAVDAEAERMSNRLDFDERQIREKYKAQRQVFLNAANEEATVREAAVRDIKIQAKYDKDVIDAEIADTMKTTAPEKHAEIKADAASRKSEIDSVAAAKLAPINSEAERSLARNAQRKLEIDRDEEQAISALEQKRSKARDRAKEKKLEIDRWTNEEMAKVAEDSRAASED